MKLITKDTDYAIKTLCYMAERSEKMFSVDLLSKALKIPRPFLRKISQQLSKKKILRSYKGKSGGFELAIKPKDIFISDVAEVFQGRLDVVECFTQGKICPNTKTCSLRFKLKQISQQVAEEFAGISIVSLIADRKGG
ncbi:MAG: Rrf2 family transcriptional regulator [bacterium]